VNVTCVDFHTPVAEPSFELIKVGGDILFGFSHIKTEYLDVRGSRYGTRRWRNYSGQLHELYTTPRVIGVIE
jgi:hypothetical protein